MLRILHPKRKKKNSEKKIFNLVTVFKSKDGMCLPLSPIDIILIVSALI